MNLIALARQFILFCGVGVVNTVLSLLVILTLSELLGVNYVIANMVGYALGLLVGFFMHRGITFASTSKNGAISRQARHFLIIFGIAYIVQLLFLILLVDFMGWNNVLSQILACALYTVINFIGNRHLTFKAIP